MNLANQALLKNIEIKTLNSGLMSSDFDLNLDHSDQVSQKLTPAAVLIAIQEIDDSLHILLTKRSSNFFITFRKTLAFLRFVFENYSFAGG